MQQKEMQTQLELLKKNNAAPSSLNVLNAFDTAVDSDEIHKIKINLKMPQLSGYAMHLPNS